jgi:hypothetical protein
MAEAVTLAGTWIVAAWGGLCLVVLVLGGIAAWSLRPTDPAEVFNTRRRLEALLDRDKGAK